MKHFWLILLLCIALLSCNNHLRRKRVEETIPSDSALAKEPYKKIVVGDLKKQYEAFYAYQSTGFNQYIGFQFFKEKTVLFSYYTESELCDVHGGNYATSLAEIHRVRGERDSTDIQLKNTFIQENKYATITFKLSENRKNLKVGYKCKAKEDKNCMLKNVVMQLVK